MQHFFAIAATHLPHLLLEFKGGRTMLDTIATARSTGIIPKHLYIMPGRLPS